MILVIFRILEEFLNKWCYSGINDEFRNKWLLLRNISTNSRQSYLFANKLPIPESFYCYWHSAMDTVFMCAYARACIQEIVYLLWDSWEL